METFDAKGAISNDTNFGDSPMSWVQTLMRPLAYVPAPIEHERTVTTTVRPDHVVIPLEYPRQVFYKPLVEAGDRVLKNQIIGQSELGNCVHASISGVVKEIKSIWTARSYHVPAVVIERNASGTMAVNDLFECYGVPYQSASRIQKLKALGVISPWTLPGKFHHEEYLDRFPDVTHVVIRSIDEEPTVFTSRLLLQQRTKDLARGIMHLKDLAPGATISLVVPKSLSQWTRERFGDLVRVTGISDDYKNRIERLLIPRLTGVDIPNTVAYRQVGVAVVSIENLLAIADALEGNGPFVSKYVTIAGDSIKKPVTVRVPIGTPIRTVLESQGIFENSYARLLVGGPMKGIAQFSDETPLTKTSHGLFLMSSEALPEEVNLTCMNCGRCTTACPVNLQVHLISRYVEHDFLSEAISYQPTACNECGLCAYVCPAHRPLVQLLQMCKKYIEQSGETSNQ